MNPMEQALGALAPVEAPHPDDKMRRMLEILMSAPAYNESGQQVQGEPETPIFPPPAPAPPHMPMLHNVPLDPSQPVPLHNMPLRNQEQLPRGTRPITPKDWT